MRIKMEQQSMETTEQKPTDNNRKQRSKRPKQDKRNKFEQKSGSNFKNCLKKFFEGEKRNSKESQILKQGISEHFSENFTSEESNVFARVYPENNQSLLSQQQYYFQKNEDSTETELVVTNKIHDHPNQQINFEQNNQTCLNSYEEWPTQSSSCCRYYERGTDEDFIDPKFKNDQFTGDQQEYRRYSNPNPRSLIESSQRYPFLKSLSYSQDKSKNKSKKRIPKVKISLSSIYWPDAADKYYSRDFRNRVYVPSSDFVGHWSQTLGSPQEHNDQNSFRGNMRQSQQQTTRKHSNYHYNPSRRHEYQKSLTGKYGEPPNGSYQYSNRGAQYSPSRETEPPNYKQWKISTQQQLNDSDGNYYHNLPVTSEDRRNYIRDQQNNIKYQQNYTRDQQNNTRDQENNTKDQQNNTSNQQNNTIVKQNYTRDQYINNQRNQQNNTKNQQYYVRDQYYYTRDPQNYTRDPQNFTRDQQNYTRDPQSYKRDQQNLITKKTSQVEYHRVDDDKQLPTPGRQPKNPSHSKRKQPKTQTTIKGNSSSEVTNGNEPRDFHYQNQPGEKIPNFSTDSKENGPTQQNKIKQMNSPERQNDKSSQIKRMHQNGKEQPSQQWAPNKKKMIGGALLAAVTTIVYISIVIYFFV